MGKPSTRLRYVAAVVPAFLAALVVAWSPVGLQLDHWAYDAMLVGFPAPSGPSAAVIVAIDEESLDAYGGLANLRRPLAEALQILQRHEPAVIAVDVVLAEPRTAEENAALVEALGKVENVILAANLRAANLGATGSSGETSWEMPLAGFRERAAALGHVHAEPDSDGVCRRIVLAKAAGRTRLWAMALEAYRLSSGGGPIVESLDSLDVAGRAIPTSIRNDRELLIRFRGANSPIERISLRSILENPDAAAVVRGRGVFIGVDVLGGIDRYLMTPYSFGTPISGVTINADVYETLHGGKFLTRVGNGVGLMFALLLALGLGLAFWRLAGMRMLIAAAGCLVAANIAPAAVFGMDHVLSFSTLALPAWAVFMTGAAYHYLVIRRQLTQAEQERGRYQRAVHYVTHEMRTPLTAIQGSSELITKYELSDEKRKELGGLIYSESQRLARMVDMFLGVERLAHGDLELQRRAIDPESVLREAVDRASPLARKKSIDLRFDECAASKISADAEFLEYACYNLISNAVKYSPAHTQVTVRARDDFDHVLIEVRDQGYGMDESDIKRIFHRFYRTKSAEQSAEGGSGLGLALVEEIVLQHGGSIEVESEVDRGSCFRLRFPRAAAGGVSRGPAAEGLT